MNASYILSMIIAVLHSKAGVGKKALTREVGKYQVIGAFRGSIRHSQMVVVHDDDDDDDENDGNNYYGNDGSIREVFCRPIISHVQQKRNDEAVVSVLGSRLGSTSNMRRLSSRRWGIGIRPFLAVTTAKAANANNSNQCSIANGGDTRTQCLAQGR